MTGDLTFQGGWDQDVHVDGPESFAFDFFSAREASDLLVLGLPFGQCVQVDAVWVGQGR
ncbi:hypothetical protein D3C76_1824370 [compost metagenome]